MTELADRRCEPCKGGVPPLRPEQLAPLLEQLDPDWRVIDAHHLRREFKLANFRKALDFTSAVGELAEEQFHHPDIELAWGRD